MRALIGPKGAGVAVLAAAVLLRRILLTVGAVGALVFGAVLVIGGSRVRGVAVAAELAAGTPASTSRVSAPAQLEAALKILVTQLAGHLNPPAGLSPSARLRPQLPVPPLGVPRPSARGFACPVTSSGPCSAAPCRLFTDSPSVSRVAPADYVGTIYEINATVGSLAQPAGAETCSSHAPAYSLPVSATRYARAARPLPSSG